MFISHTQCPGVCGKELPAASLLVDKWKGVQPCSLQAGWLGEELKGRLGVQSCFPITINTPFSGGGDSGLPYFLFLHQALLWRSQGEVYSDHR